MDKKVQLIAILIFFTLTVDAQWSTDSNGINYSSGNVGIGRSSVSDRTLLVYKQDLPYFGVENEHGSFDLGIAHDYGHFAVGARPGDAVIKLHGYTLSRPYNGLFINMNVDDNDGNSFIKFVDSYKEIMAIYNNAIVKIDGKLLAKEIEVKTNVWADYVFKPGYKLMPLDELETFIEVNNHLPDIPTEAEVKENGINIAEMNAKLLQKVEELTLYIIEQQKQINALKDNSLE